MLWGWCLYCSRGLSARRLGQRMDSNKLDWVGCVSPLSKQHVASARWKHCRATPTPRQICRNLGTSLVLRVCSPNGIMDQGGLCLFSQMRSGLETCSSLAAQRHARLNSQKFRNMQYDCAYMCTILCSEQPKHKTSAYQAEAQIFTLMQHATGPEASSPHHATSLLPTGRYANTPSRLVTAATMMACSHAYNVNVLRLWPNGRPGHPAEGPNKLQYCTSQPICQTRGLSRRAESPTATH
jgi:hypothetical protein